MDFLDIADAIYYKAGGEVSLNSESARVFSLLKDRKKTVFILIDGMGAIILNNLLPDSFLNKNVKDVATTIFPSTTSVVLTSLATGKYPAIHSVNGWFSYISETNESIVSLPFVDRFEMSKKLEVEFNDVFSGDARMGKIPSRVSVISNSGIIKSEYSIWSRGNTTGYAYRTLKGAFQTLSRLINKDNEREYIYLYIDEFDSVCHKFGPDSEDARKTLKKIDEHVEKFSRVFENRVNAIITADHGQIRVKNENFFTIDCDDEIMDFLVAPPSGDSRFVCFHVKDGCASRFREVFDRRFGRFARLLSVEELDESRLLGPYDMCDKAKMRFGDFCALFNTGYAFLYVKRNFKRSTLKVGCHSGISDEEMKIPLIVIN